MIESSEIEKKKKESANTIPVNSKIQKSDDLQKIINHQSVLTRKPLMD